MGILGFFIQLGTAGFAVYLGYTFQLNYIYLLLCPFGFIFGQLMRHSTGRSKRREKGLSAISAFISGYFVGLVAVAIFFGIGFGLMHILDMRPEEGVGRY
jgi:hypothetical protein